jgi:hypothetical protein
MTHRIMFKWARSFIPLLLLLAYAGAHPALAAPAFYRIIDGPNPGPAQRAKDEFIYGAKVLYTGDAKQGHPTHVDGTVWHANLREAEYFIGTRNPVIEQLDILKLIESDKWEEAKILMAAVPDAFPRTENLADVIRAIGDNPALSDPQKLERLSQELKRRYPEGFFLKPISGFSSDGTFPSDKSDFDAVYESFIHDVKPVIERRLKETGGDSDTVHLELKRMPNYSGRVLEQLLAHPEQVIVQAKISPAFGAVVRTAEGPKPLIVEFRVHVVEGKVLVGATETRWEDLRSVSGSTYAEVEAFAQHVVNRLPPAMRKMCFGMDVMKTADGRYKVVELNGGGESAYLYPDTDLWIAQLLAKHFRGSTELLDEFARFKSRPTLAEKEAALSRLLKRPELADLAREVAPMTELLTHAKDALLAEFRAMPTRDNAFAALLALKRFKLEPYLTASEIESVGTVLHDPTALDPGARLSRLSLDLGLNEGEILFVGTQGELRLINGLSYDDAAVEKLLTDELARRLTGQKLTHGRLAREARALVDQAVATRAELSASRTSLDSLARDLESRAGRRLFYSGGRSALVREIMTRIIERP